MSTRFNDAQATVQSHEFAGQMTGGTVATPNFTVPQILQTDQHAVYIYVFQDMRTPEHNNSWETWQAIPRSKAACAIGGESTALCFSGGGLMASPKLN
jgi:hypothetical protein